MSTIYEFTQKYRFVNNKKLVYTGVMQSLLEIVSENVRFYRKKTGLSQLKLAYQLEIAPSYLAEIERGKQYPSLKMLERLAKYFDIEPYRLLYPMELNEQAKTSMETIQTLRFLQHQINNIFEQQINSSM